MGCACSSTARSPGPVVAPTHGFQVWTKEPVEFGAKPDRIALIANPNSGGKRGLKVLAQILPVFEESGVAVIVLKTEYPGHAQELARTAEEKVICALGGDGTAHEVVNGVMCRPDHDSVTVGILPAGTGNTLAYDMGIASAKQGAEQVIGGRVRQMDLLVVDGMPDTGHDIMREPSKPTRLYSLNMVGWGLPAAVMGDADKMRIGGGGAQYNLAAYKQVLVHPRYRAIVEVPDDEVSPEIRARLAEDRDYTMIQAQTTIHMGEKMAFCPQSKLDDGLMDLMLLPHTGRGTFVQYMEAAKKGSHVDPEKPCPQETATTDYIQVSSVVVRPVVEGRRQPKYQVGPKTVNVDGELVGVSPFRVAVAPLALRVYA